MPRKRHLVKLSEEERQDLLGMIRKGNLSARRLTRAHILLQAHDSATDEDTAASLHVGVATVERTRKKYAEGGLAQALGEKPRPGGRRKLDGKQEAFLIATACSTPPDGRSHWTMQLLADRLVSLELVEAVSDETVRRILKKTTSSRG